MQKGFAVSLSAKEYHDFDILDNPPLKNYFPVNNGTGHSQDPAEPGAEPSQDPAEPPTDQSDPPVDRDQQRANSTERRYLGDPPTDPAEPSQDRAEPPTDQDHIDQDHSGQEDPASDPNQDRAEPGAEPPTDQDQPIPSHQRKPKSAKEKAFISFQKKLSGLHRLILRELVFLANLQKKKNAAFYCFPSHGYLADKLDCASKTIERKINDLVDWKLITVIHRRPLAGQWQSNIYKPWRGLAVVLQEVNLDKALLEFLDEQEPVETPQTEVSVRVEDSLKKNITEEDPKKDLTDKNVCRLSSVPSSNSNNQEPDKSKEKTGGENKEKAEGQGLEETWQRLLRKYHDYPVVPAWTQKEKDQAKDLENNRYGDEARKLLIFSIKNWGKAKAEYNFLPALPVWDSLYYHRDKFFALMLAARKAEAKAGEALREREGWEKMAEYNNGNGKPMREHYEAAQKQIRQVKQNGQRKPAQVAEA